MTVASHAEEAEGIRMSGSVGPAVTDEVMALSEMLGDLRDLVADLTDEEFSRPTCCDGWTVAEVVVHCGAPLLALVSENAKEVDGAPEVDRFGVYLTDPSKPYPFAGQHAWDGFGSGEKANRTLGDVISDRAVTQARGWRPAQLRVLFGFIADGVISALPEIPADRVIRRPPRYPRMLFNELVASRNLEFGVHLMDIAEAVGRPPELRTECAAIIAGMLDHRLGQTIPESLGWDPTRYIQIGMGRRELTPGERETLGSLADRFPLIR
jgi:uncharacterized protein (TIGR03083 family)